MLICICYIDRVKCCTIIHSAANFKCSHRQWPYLEIWKFGIFTDFVCFFCFVLLLSTKNLKNLNISQLKVRLQQLFRDIIVRLGLIEAFVTAQLPN